jgi:hypothetical protein
MDIGRAFGYVFDDDRWITKILIAAAILLGGIVFGVLVIPALLAAFLLNGYGLEITRRVIRGDTQVLPEWDNWGELLTDGLKVFVVELVYALPMIVVGVCLSISMSALGNEGEAAGSALGALMGCFNLLWGIVMGLFLPAAIAFLAARGELSAAFRFGDVFALVRDNFATYLIVLVLYWVASLIGGLGLLVCGVGLLFTAPYAGWITSHLYGQAYLEATGHTAQPMAAEETA